VYNKTGYPLKIVGIGSDATKLRAMSKSNIEFAGWQSDEQILELYRACRMLVFSGEEDFGTVPLEAQACGKPVVAYRKGGVMESVKEGVSGIFFEEQSDESLTAAISKCADTKWDPSAIRANAGQFSIQRFINDLATSISKCLAEH